MTIIILYSAKREETLHEHCLSLTAETWQLGIDNWPKLGCQTEFKVYAWSFPFLFNPYLTNFTAFLRNDILNNTLFQYDNHVNTHANISPWEMFKSKALPVKDL